MTGTLRIMDRRGHTSVSWSTDLQETVDAANRKFNEMLEQGYSAYVMHGTTNGEQVAVFDAQAESILMVPRMVGG